METNKLTPDELARVAPIELEQEPAGEAVRGVYVDVCEPRFDAMDIADALRLGPDERAEVTMSPDGSQLMGIVVPASRTKPVVICWDPEGGPPRARWEAS